MKIMKKINENDKKILRDLAKKYRDISEKEEMGKLKQLWKNLHDLNPKRPMILFEPFSLEVFLSDYKFKCSDPELRNVENRMVCLIRQHEQLDDDLVLEPYFRIGWWGKDIIATAKEYGDIIIKEHGATNPSMAYISNFPIKTPDDIKKLKPRNFKIDKEPSLNLKSRLEDIFGDILPVKLANFDNFVLENGNQPFTGNNFIGITWVLFKLIGAQNMMLWAYDFPDAIHELCRFLADDRKSFYKFMIDEKLLDFNTDNQFAGPSSYGYVSKLPQVGTEKKAELKDLWAWPESQETQSFSPSMFNEFFLPYIAEIANMFGLTYYGCCETITDRFEYIEKAIHNLRTVSVSGWSDIAKAGELLNKKYVFSKKPVPAYVSTETPNWDLVKKEAEQTSKATKNDCVEIIFRDAYSKNITIKRASEWINIWKKAMGI
jgi:hypothetical protein